ncbi:MAG TPA: aldose epimerase family protein [Terracidiphilus sp.]|nr:aldose epimerase family protein [Terracidiphilus sp.]
MKRIASTFLAASLAAACSGLWCTDERIAGAAGAPSGAATSFGKTADGTEVLLYTLKNKHGVVVAITNYGATLVSLIVPDRLGRMADVVWGYDSVAGYEQGKSYFGGTIGRYANRIAKGSFALGGENYHLAKNNGHNSLHGGIQGFNRVIWKAIPLSSHAVEFTYTSKDGEEGYPGTLHVKVTYTLSGANELRLDYSATDEGKDTIVNLTNHSYFNLTGDPQNTILQHQVTLYASRFTPVDATLIPTGELRPVKGTPFDFTRASMVGERIEQNNEQLKLAGGYDHNFVIDRSNEKGLVKAAEVYEPSTGRDMEVFTTEPGVQFYSGNFLDGTEKGKGGRTYGFRSALTLETQHYPDSPNHPEFPSTVLRPGETFQSSTIYRFSTR